jgi:phosphohistidine phosphatase
MKTLLILRHGKSSHKDAGLPDHERPLTRRGKDDAPRMGELASSKGLAPDLIVCSTARRAHVTAKRAAEGGGFDCPIKLREDVYNAPGDDLIAALRGCPDDRDRVMLIAHNPGLEELLGWLTGETETLPTCALAHVELDVDRWSELRPGSGKLEHLWRPRELAFRR